MQVYKPPTFSKDRLILLARDQTNPCTK